MCLVKAPKMPEPEPLPDPVITKTVKAVEKPAATRQKKSRGKSMLTIPRNTSVGGLGSGPKGPSDGPSI